MALQGLANFCGKSNLGGLMKIEYAETSRIDADSFEPVVSAAWNWQQEIDFVEGTWLEAFILPSKRLWNESQGKGTQGKFYDQTVRAIVPNLLPTVAGELDEMAMHRFLLRLCDQDGQKWLLGSLESPFDFKADGTTGENGQLKHHAIRFISRTKNKAYGFEPVL